MFKEVSKFLFVVIALMMFVGVGTYTIYLEFKEFTEYPLYAEEYSRGLTTDKRTDIIDGNQLLGMILLALRGEYIIIVDGVVISETTDPQTLLLSGVAGRPYKISSTRDPVSSQLTIIANVM